MVDKLVMSKNIRNTTFGLDPANKPENRAIPPDNKGLDDQNLYRKTTSKTNQNLSHSQVRKSSRKGLSAYIRMKKPHLAVGTVAMHTYPQLHSLLERQDHTIMSL
jgi:hypothetical protein